MSCHAVIRSSVQYVLKATACTMAPALHIARGGRIEVVLSSNTNDTSRLGHVASPETDH